MEMVLFLALFTIGVVTSFSISHRSERNTDLAEALAILQRQRRRVGVDDFLSSERSLEGRPLTLEDVNDWLSRTNGNDVMSDEDVWMPEERNFKDFQPSDDRYDLSPAVYPPFRTKASDNEVNDIFADEDAQADSEHVSGSPQKKTKEEIVNLQGDMQTRNKQIELSPVQTETDKTSVSGEHDNGEALNSLTDEEVRVLMKAVGKLQQRAADMNKEKKSIETDVSQNAGSDSMKMVSSDDGREVIVSQPVSQEELKSVFTETNGPITKETKIAINKEPDQNEPDVIEQEIVSEKLPDESTIVRERELTNSLPQAIEDELEAEQAEAAQNEENNSVDEASIAEAESEAVAAAAEEAVAEAAEEENEQQAEDEAEERAVEDAVAEEIANMNKERLSPELVSKYLLMNRDKLYLPQNRHGVKRTAKRASGLYANDLMSNNDMSTDGSLESAGIDSPTLIQAFVAKILALQDEIDGLRFKNRLEDLENDELTDALNEATLGQKEGTVSNEEWKSLQHAIEIEQALQDLKKKESSTPTDGNLLGGNVVGDDDNDDDVVVEDKRKRGEPWNRKREREADVMDGYGTVIASRSSPSEDREVPRVDIDRLLASAFLMKDDDEEDDDNEEEGDVSFGGSEDEPIASLFMPRADRCPAIQRYSNNCELADLYNLPVDFEARALCNLHEMCYACGHSLGVSQSQCDLVYTAAVSSLCHQKEVCIAESEIFLRAMKLKTRYVPHAQPTCRSRCTAQFMGMF